MPMLGTEGCSPPRGLRGEQKGPHTCLLSGRSLSPPEASGSGYCLTAMHVGWSRPGSTHREEGSDEGLQH